MNARFKRVFRKTAAVHFGLILVFLICRLIWDRPRPIKPKEMVTFVDLTGGGGGGPPPAVETVPAQDVKPPPQAAVQPVEQPPVRESIPEVKPKKPKVEKSTKKITRAQMEQQPPKPQQAKPALKPQDIRNSLSSAIKSAFSSSGYGPGTGTGPGSDSPVAWYYALVREIMYEAWDQPSSLSASAGLSATVTIRVQRDGSISEWKMTSPSGNSLMDESVKKAVESVHRIRPLPPQFVGSYQDIVVLFELTHDTL